MPTQEELQAAAEAFAKPEPRKELTKEEDLKRVMDQIKAMEGASLKRALDINKDSALPEEPQPSSLGATQEPILTSPAFTAAPAAPVPPQSPPDAPPWLHNVVEVIAKGPHYGQLFRLGDMKGGKAHGYIIKEQGGREYITLPADQIATIGKPRVKSLKYCSGQWMQEHREVE